MMTWKVSKWIHIGWVGLVRRPWANVSASRRWLNSSFTEGWGIGNKGKTAIRVHSARSPTTMAASLWRRANLPKYCSALPNQFVPTFGQTNAITRAIRTRASSIQVNIESVFVRLTFAAFKTEIELAAAAVLDGSQPDANFDD
jgi:hypothetical protein